jgi:hypothetical protein
MSVTFEHVVFDCTDPLAQAEFWAGVLERPVDDGSTPHFATVGMPRRGEGPMPVFMFVAVPEERAGKNRLHVDLGSTDRAAEVDRLVALGASPVGDFDEYGARWTTLADPEGNVFDVAQAG